MEPEFLEVKNITKRYKNKFVIDDISFFARKGEVLTITGDNGAGKSTLLSILATLQKPTAGNIYLDGIDMIKYSGLVRRDISYIPQEICLHLHMTLWDNLKFWAAMSGLTKKGSKQAHEMVISLLSLEAYLKTKVHKLSGGIQRRANIAAALYNKPKLLLMDEPTAGVDSDTRTKILDFVTLIKNTGVCVLYVTHIADEIAFFQNQIQSGDNRRLTLDNGKIGFCGKAGVYT